MVHVQFGTDVYGSVKTVNGTSVRTKFFALWAIPVYPLQSWYCESGAVVRNIDAHSIAEMRVKTTVNGFPLQKLDIASVLMGYLRPFFGCCLVLGCVSLCFWTSGLRLDDAAMAMRFGCTVAFVIGVVGLGLTFLVPLMTSRERAIRRYCGKVLELSADPARVAQTTALSLMQSVPLVESSDPFGACLRRLVLTRVEMAVSGRTPELEQATDDLLDELDRFEHNQAALSS